MSVLIDVFTSTQKVESVGPLKKKRESPGSLVNITTKVIKGMLLSHKMNFLKKKKKKKKKKIEV